jgi:hypothetical protein
MKHFFTLLTLSTLMLLGTAPVQAAYFTSGENATLSSEQKQDSFIAGQNVSITAPIAGELFAAGRSVTIDKKTDRSIFAAGQTVNISGGAGYNAFVAGSDVTLSGEFGHDVYVAAETITIADGTVINGDLKIAGGDVKLAGTVKGNVNYTASSVKSNATIGGHLKGDEESLEFTGGSVAGDLVYTSSKDATGLDKVKIGGKTDRTQPTTTNQKKEIGGAITAANFTQWFLLLLSSLVVGAFFILFAPKKVAGVTQLITEQWGRSFLTGLLVMILTPFIVVLLFATVIGWRIALSLLLLYFVAFILFSAFGSIVVGGWILNRLGDDKASWWVKLLVGVVVLAILRAIPVLGPIISVIAFIALTIPTFGAVLHWYREQVA